MSARNFLVHSCSVPGQHIREYVNSTAGACEDVLYLDVNQYIPLDNLNPEFGDVTIIAAHANGYTKELYEPLWDHLLEFSRSPSAGFRIRSIWMCDMAHQGGSGVTNEQTLGINYSWFDHSRDLLRIVDHFRKDMPLPIVGIGHSMGAAQLVGLAQMHPRLLSDLVLIDPQIRPLGGKNVVALTKHTALQKDIWPSQAEAEAALLKSPVYKSWDPTVLERHFATTFRATPTPIYPDAPAGSITKRTSKHQEFITAHRPNIDRINQNGKPVTVEQLASHPDVDVNAPIQYPFYAAGQRQAFLALPSIRPAILYIHGSKSPIATPGIRQQLLELAGSGVGGSGGAAIGKVQEVLLPGSHFVPFELPREVAMTIADYLGPRMQQWLETAQARRTEWQQLSLKQKQTIDENIKKHVVNYDKEAVVKIKQLASKL